MTDTERRAVALRIAAHTALDPRTVLSMFDGRRVRAATLASIVKAAAELNIELPSMPAKRKRAA